MTDPKEHLMADVLDQVEVRLDLGAVSVEGNTSMPIAADIDGDFGKRVLQRR